MKRWVIVIAVWFGMGHWTSVMCQDLIAIRGKILDSVSGKPVSFAMITLEGTEIGTSANDDGVFFLNIPQIFGSGSMLIYSMGYKMAKIDIPQLQPSPGIIFLAPSPMTLKEIEVIGYTPQEVLKRAVQRIPENYGNDSVLLTAFVRVQKIIGNRIAEFTEAIIADLKDGYYLYSPGETDRKKERSNTPQLLRGRVNSDTNLVNALGVLGKQAFCLYCNFTPDIVEFYHDTPLDEKEFRKYEYRMTERTGDEGGKIYHIRFDQKEDVREMLFTGEIIIRAADFAIEKVLLKPSMNAFDQYEKGKYRTEYSFSNTPGWYREMPMGQTILTYSKRGEFYSLATIRTNYTMTFIQPALGKTLRYQYKTDVVVTNGERDDEKLRVFRGDKSIGRDQRWDQIIDPGDASFWSGFNYLPIEESLQNSIPAN